MKPLIVLLVSFGIAIAVGKFLLNDFNIALSGRIAMSIMLAFAAIAHLAFTKGMEMMLPDFIPFKRTMVYLTGIIEICAWVGLLIPNFETLTDW